VRRFSLQLLLWLGLALLLPSFAPANPITDENALPGNSGWEVSQADTTRIQGYTDKTSVGPGETIGFHVSTSPSASYRINIYRLGWYNGAGARRVACLPSCSTSSSGSARSTPSPNSQTGKIDANTTWGATPQLSWTVPGSATTGEYVAVYTLMSGSQSGTARYSPFLVRSNAPQAQASNILVVVPYNTYLAYNAWGGTSAYVNTTNGSFDLAHATKVSFNRPFDRKHWSYWDLPLVHFLEREGYDVSYASDTDVDANPQILQQHRTVIVSGHSEYWSKNMRDGFEAARDAGTNLFFAGANDAYWQVRYEDSSCASDDTICGTVGNRRTMVIYKEEESDQVDPISNPSLKTIQWRDLGRPECELQGGVQYGSWFPNDGYDDYTTTSAGASDSWAAGTGLHQGSTISGLVGFEFDSFFPDCDVPGTPTILFSYQSAFTDADIDSAAVRYTANGSGARVFSSGTEQWSWGLDSYRWDPTLFTGIPPTNPAIQQYTRNILADMARPAAPEDVDATLSSGSIQIDTTPRDDPRITGYKIYRHSGTSSFQPGDPGVTLVCQNSSGDCTDAPPGGTYRYASAAVDQWSDSSAALSNSVSITTPVNAVDDSATLNEDAGATAINVLANDTPSGATKTITSKTNGTHGTVAITGGGTGLTYQPAANYCGPDSFTYTINSSSTATVSMTVNCVDDPPTAVNDSASVGEDAGATAVPVLTNDTDIDGGPMTIISKTNGSHGTVAITGGGTGLTYQPNADYCGSDSFTYTLNGSDSATVSMTVTCVDDPPTAVNDSATVNEDAGATAVPVLNNDTDVDGGTKTITNKTNGAHGTVAITGGGSGLTYQPAANYCGSDSFTYTLTPGGDTATVSVTVTCVDDPPTAVNDSASVDEDDPATSLDVLDNDTDIDSGPMTINSKTNGAHGTVAITGGGTGLTYQPAANYCGSDSFTYTLTPGGDTAAVSVTVTCVDDPPPAVNDSKTINEDAGATAIGVLGNDLPDIDGGPKAVASFSPASHGTVTGVGPSGAWTDLRYQPDGNYCGADSFTYALTPGGDTATVSMTVTCVDDPPTAVADDATVGGGSGANQIDVLANDTDIDGGPKAISSVSQPSHGEVAITGGGTGLTYQPDAGYCDDDSFSYVLTPGGDSAVVSIAVDCSEAPTAVGDTVTVTQDSGPNPIDALANDVDPDGGPKLIEAITEPSNGTAAIAGDGSGLTYQPNAGYCNSLPGMTLDGFLYTLNGGSTASVSVTVTCAAGAVEGGSTAKPKPVKCKKKSHKKGKAKCKKKRKRKRRR
jgi:hypothetical protein